MNDIIHILCTHLRILTQVSVYMCVRRSTENQSFFKEAFCHVLFQSAPVWTWFGRTYFAIDFENSDERNASTLRMTNPSGFSVVLNALSFLEQSSINTWTSFSVVRPRKITGGNSKLYSFAKPSTSSQLHHRSFSRTPKR